MDDIKNIEIRINEYGISYDLNIIPSELKVLIKNKEKEIDINTIEKILDIICKWDYNYINDTIIDAPTCKIVVNTTEKTDEYFLKGRYPNTYNALRKIVSDIYE